ncbi:MAG: iron ABC transporter permease [Granulosicoccus sp.]|nr:iron ABC transporter permease [Granulosicoccus sp.]
MAVASSVDSALSGSRAKTSGIFVNRWSVFAAAIAILVCLPTLTIIYLALFPSENIWGHLFRTVLPDYVITTLLLMAGVMVGTSLIGISTAWFVTHYEFPGRRLFTWMLLLPFAVPSYVLAYVYTDLLEFAGPVQSQLRDWFGWATKRDYYFPAIRSTGGATMMLVLVLYPYVFLLARSAFIEQSSSVLEVAQVLGKSRSARFFKVALPMARPAIIIGISMALMETLNDFGTVSYFAVQTLTLGIYDVWLGMGNLGGGAQIAALLLLLVFLLLSAERSSRKTQMVYQHGGSRMRPLRRKKLRGYRSAATVLLCLTPIILGFFVPLIVLVRYSIIYFSVSWTPEFKLAAIHSLTLATAAAIIAVTVGVILSYSLRLQPNRFLRRLTSLATLGYAVPGVVLALGIIIPFGWLDNTVDAFAREQFGFSTGLILSGTVFALLFAYTVRFLAVAFGSVDASLRKISPSMDDAARSLGKKPFTILRQIHLPLMKGGLLTGVLIVFVDCMKELPATLLMRPFNYDTLATHVYQYASGELIEQSALGALLIVATGLLPVILLSKSIDRTRKEKTE